MLRGYVAVVSTDSPSPDVTRITSSCRKSTIRLFIYNGVFREGPGDLCFHIECTHYHFKVPGNVRMVDRSNITSGIVRLGFSQPNLDLVIYTNSAELEAFMYTMEAFKEPILSPPKCSDRDHAKKLSCICMGPKFSQYQVNHNNKLDCPFSVLLERLCKFCCYNMLESYSGDDARKIINTWKSQLVIEYFQSSVHLMNSISVTSYPYLSNITATGLGLVEIPEQLGSLPCLAHLHLSRNRLWQATNWNWLASPFIRENLRELHLDRNKLSTFPEPIVRLRNLEILKLDWNNLTEIPAALGSLKELRLPVNLFSHLDVCYNKLTIVPGWIYRQKRFSILQIERNCLNFSTDFPRPQLSPKDFEKVGVSSLFEMLARYIITEKLAFWEYNIPPSVEEYLERVYVCRCGSIVFPDATGPVVHCSIHANAVAEHCRTPIVTIDIRCCSYKCYRVIENHMNV